MDDDYRQWPRRLWGSEDHKRDVELKGKLAQMGEPPVAQPLHSVATFPLYGDPVGDERRRKRETDRLLEKHSFRPRRFF